MEDESYDLNSVSSWDQRKWEAFFTEVDPIIRSVCKWQRWRFAPYVADEMHQSVRTRLPKALAAYNGRAPLRHYIKKIAIFACIDRVRQEIIASQRRFEPTDSDADHQPWMENIPDEKNMDPHACILANERAHWVQTALERLDQTCRDAIRMFYVEDISYQEMARRLGVTVNTVGSRLAKCREKLRAMLTGPDDHGE